MQALSLPCRHGSRLAMRTARASCMVVRTHHLQQVTPVPLLHPCSHAAIHLCSQTAGAVSGQQWQQRWVVTCAAGQQGSAAGGASSASASGSVRAAAGAGSNSGAGSTSSAGSARAAGSNSAASSPRAAGSNSTAGSPKAAAGSSSAAGSSGGSSSTGAASSSKAAPPAAAKKKTIFPKGAHQRDFRVWLDREKGNKLVTRITEVNRWCLPPGREEYLREMSKALKQKCGAGGAVKMDTWEVLVQGDHRKAVLAALAEWGHMAKAAGG